VEPHAVLERVAINGPHPFAEPPVEGNGHHIDHGDVRTAFEVPAGSFCLSPSELSRDPGSLRWRSPWTPSHEFDHDLDRAAFAVGSGFQTSGASARGKRSVMVAELLSQGREIGDGHGRPMHGQK
jgi:hypothetical protein